jgi:hypothetical protein
MPLRRGARNPACVTKLSSHRGAGILAGRVGIRADVFILRCARRMSPLRDTLARRVAEDRRDGFAPFMVVATGRDQGSRRDRSTAGSGALLPVGGSMGFMSMHRRAAAP